MRPVTPLTMIPIGLRSTVFPSAVGGHPRVATPHREDAPQHSIPRPGPRMGKRFPYLSRPPGRTARPAGDQRVGCWPMDTATDETASGTAQQAPPAKAGRGGRGAGRSGEESGAAVTLADVARRARVSPATASRVINGSAKHVADELRARVLKAVEELRYVPNAHAQSLARSQRNAVGVIVHDVSDPYFAEITRGLQRVATDHGRLLVICNSYRDPARELEYVEMLRGQQVAAIV